MKSVTLEWMEADSIKLLPQWQSSSLNIVPLLLALPDRKTAWIGWYYGGLLNEFRVDGSPQEQHPTHWMPLPELP